LLNACSRPTGLVLLFLLFGWISRKLKLRT